MLELFISGKNSGYVSAGIAATMQSLGYSTCVYKPIQFNAVIENDSITSPDLVFVKKLDNHIATYSSYLIPFDKFPDIHNNVMEVITKDYETIREEYECVIVCGVDEITSAIEHNLIKLFNVPVLFIVNSEEDINYLMFDDVKLRGMLVNDISLMKKGINVLGMVPNIKSNVRPDDLITEVLTGMDLERIFDVKIAKLQF